MGAHVGVRAHMVHEAVVSEQTALGEEGALVGAGGRNRV